MLNKLKCRGRVKVFMNGDLVREVPNLVVDSGLAWFATRIKDGTGDDMSHMAIGDGTSTPLPADTTLENELTRSALGAVNGTLTDTTLTFEATFGAGSGTGTVTEAGIFSADTAGTMLAHTLMGPITKGAVDVMTISWSIDLMGEE